jgi:hypothetical protein
VNGALSVIGADGHEFVDVSRTAHASEGAHEPLVVSDHTEDVAIEQDEVDERRRQLISAQKVNVFHTEVEGKADDGILWEVGRYVSH